MKQYLFNINSLTCEEAEKCISLMSAERKIYVNSVSNQKRKLETVAGEWIAKKAVSQFLSLPVEQITIERSKKGKPYVKGRDIYISISHSGDFVAAAVDTKPVGIDIEVIKPIDLKITDRVCTDNDKKLLFSAKNESEAVLNFFKIWTAKEAYFKMTGTGIADMKSVSYKDTGAVHSFEQGLIITVVH